MKSIKIIDGANEFEFTDTREGGTLFRTLEGFAYPTVRPVIEDLPVREGSHYITSKFGRRRIGINAHLVNDCINKRRELVSAMSQGALKVLRFTTFDDLELQAEVEVVSVNALYTKLATPILVELVAPDPRLYSQALQSTTTVTTNIIGGTEIPTAIPLSLAVTSGVQKPIIINNGTSSAPATFVIEGPGTNFTIQNQTTGDILYLNLTLLTGERVTITETTAVKGTNQNVFGSVSGTRWSVQPGSNIVHFDALTGSDSNTKLTVSFRHSYMGV